MNPVTFDQVVTVASVVVAVVVPVVTLALTARRDGDAARKAAETAAMDRQRTSDKLDTIDRNVQETRDTLRTMSQEVTAQKVASAAVSATLDDHERRITAIELRCDRNHAPVGGTE